MLMAAAQSGSIEIFRETLAALERALDREEVGMNERFAARVWLEGFVSGTNSTHGVWCMGEVGSVWVSCEFNTGP